MEIRPVPLDQIVAGKFGRQYVIAGEAGRIAARLTELDDSLHVEFNEKGEFFVVLQTIPDGPRRGETSVVMRVPMMEWDDRVIKEWEMRAHEMRNGIDPLKRIEAGERAKRAADEYDLEQMIGERAAPLFRSFQRAYLGVNPRSFRPKEAFRLKRARHLAEA